VQVLALDGLRRSGRWWLVALAFALAFLAVDSVVRLRRVDALTTALVGSGRTIAADDGTLTGYEGNQHDVVLGRLGADAPTPARVAGGRESGRSPHPDDALAWLERAVTRGFRSLGVLQSDEDFADVAQHHVFSRDASGESRTRRCASSSIANGDIPTRDAFYSERLSVLLRKIEFLCSAVITPENGLNNLAGLE
jgi:hypothetical protein